MYILFVITYAIKKKKVTYKISNYNRYFIIRLLNKLEHWKYWCFTY